jgi:hypothetical protein
MGVSGQRHAPAALYPQERTPDTHWTGGWVGPRAGLDTEASGKTVCLCRRSNPGRPVCCQTLHWLRYGVSKLEHQLEIGHFSTTENRTPSIKLATSQLRVLECQQRLTQTSFQSTSLHYPKSNGVLTKEWRGGEGLDARCFQGNGSCCIVQVGGRYDPRLNSALPARTAHKLDHGTCSELHSSDPDLPLCDMRRTFPRRLWMLSCDCPINHEFIERCFGPYIVGCSWNVQAIPS